MNDPFSTPDHWPQDPEEPPGPPPTQLPFSAAFDISRGFQSGLDAIRAAPVAMWVGGLLMVLFDSNSYQGGGDGETLAQLAQGGEGAFAVMDSPLSALQAFAPSLVWMLIAFAIAGALLLGHAFFRTGFIRQMHAVHAYGEDAYGELFGGADGMLSMLGSTILQWIAYGAILLPVIALSGAAFYFFGESGVAFGIMGVLLLLAIFPLIYVYTGLCLADFRVALDGDGPVESIRSAWRLADGNRLELFKFSFVMWLVELASAFVGLLLLCIGMLFTIPLGKALTGVAWSESYLLATRGTVD